MVGLSNVFSSAADWPGCLALVDTLFPGSTLVGYEAGDALDAALAASFRTAGPLRVWLLDGAPR